MASRTPKRRPPTRGRAWIPAGVTVIVLVGGYVGADIYDVVPGPLTISHPWPDPDPFPVATLPTARSELHLELDPHAPVPAESAVSALIEEFLADPAVGPDPGVLVVDAQSQQVLGQVQADEPKVPASTTKLLTALAALDTVGANHRLVTHVAQGAADDPQALTIVGGGDLTLDPGRGDPNAVIGHGGVARLAEQAAQELKSEGRTDITDVVVFEGLWEGSRLAPRWEDQDLNEGWIIPLAPLALNLGKLPGSMPRTSTPGEDVGEAFTKALESSGITVRGQVRRGAPVPGQVPIASVESAPLVELVEYMLVHSDNVLAEALGRLVAVHSPHPASFEGAEKAIVERLENLGVSTAGLRLADMSGLSSVNKISPRTLVQVMEVISSNHPDLLAAVRGLPVAGLEGTLRERMRQTPAAGVVAAKTGSLRRTATIAGQVHTADGRLLHVAIMTPTWENSLAQARDAIDRLLVGLARCGCS